MAKLKDLKVTLTADTRKFDELTKHLGKVAAVSGGIPAIAAPFPWVQQLIRNAVDFEKEQVEKQLRLELGDYGQFYLTNAAELSVKIERLARNE